MTFQTDELGVRLCGEFDATVWAREFVKVFPGTVPEDVMVGWFANAIMSGYDNHRWKMEKAAEPGGGGEK